ncbi:MAG: right-handed parallel beta-helix repeat-containing protein [Clostridia bacterium]|nr:right-handed parallel beta-helix repeat-containing protein [Clostridia bacterium]
MKKWVALLLVVLMACSILLVPGCKKTDGDGGSTTTTGQDDTGSTTVSDGEGSSSVVTDASGNNVTDASGNTVTNAGTTNGGGSQGGTAGTTAGGQANNGVPVIDDDLNDWNKTFEHGNQYIFDGLFDYFFENDQSRVIAGVANSKDTWMTYKIDRVEEFEVITYRHTENEKLGIEKLKTLSFYVSTDNKNWTEVKGVEIKSLDLSTQWDKTVYTKKNIDPKYTYLKIVVPPTAYASGHNVGRVRINDIANMYNLDRFFEGRQPATFYVDSKSGSDNNDGKSPEKALKSLYAVSQRYFQPGDKLLFKRGCTFSGSLTINGSGAQGNEIIVGSYGTGNLPVLKGRKGTAVTVKAVHIVIQDLAITNPNGTCGLYLLAPVTGAAKNITVKNCEFDTINTGMTDMSFAAAAIYAMAGGIEPTWFDGLTITGNTIKNINRCGIYVTTNWGYRPGGWGKEGLYKNDSNGWYPAKNVVVSNNSLDTIGGDGIMVYAADKPVLEKNVLYRGYQAPKNKHSGSAGIWVHNTNDAVLQYNEVGYMDLKSGQIDGEAYNIDIANKRTTIQYNYSHNNVAGFLLMCNIVVQEGAYDAGKTPEHTGHIVRYNISINDYGEYTKSYGFPALLMLTGDCRDTAIYNNTFYMGGDARTCYPVYADNFNGGGRISGFTFQNNIFHAESSITVKWKLLGTKFTFNNNIYSGAVMAPNVKDNDGKDVIDANAKVQTVTFAGSIPAKLDGRDKALNVRLKNAVAGATKIANNGGKDFEGKAITKEFYGALQPK